MEYNREWLRKLPKSELHVHLEGTLEPEQMLVLSERNKINIPYSSLDAIKKARETHDYPSFWQAFNAGTLVIKTDEDFYDVAKAYLKKAAEQGVVYAEITFDTQTYVPRGIKAGDIINGLHEATIDAQREYRIASALILCFLRHLPEADALVSLHSSLPYKKKIIAVGMASTEVGNPPEKFKNVFALAQQQGYHLTAHVGEYSGPKYIDQALNLLHVERIDHGVRCMEDTALVQRLVNAQIPLTVCPLSNIALGVFPSLKDHPFKKMLDVGLLVSLNSDDPAYFGGYILDVYEQTMKALCLSNNDVLATASNSFKSSFLDEQKKREYLALFNTNLSQ